MLLFLYADCIFKINVDSAVKYEGMKKKHNREKI